MGTNPTVVPKPVIFGFFVLGLISSIAFRAIILLQKYDPAWVRPTWYVGVFGYMIFFLYRYRISQRRKSTIERTGIVGKLERGDTLSVDDREAALYLVNSIRKSPEDWNYFAIGALSVIAVILDLVL
jgi:hypothetical protein